MAKRMKKEDLQEQIRSMLLSRAADEEEIPEEKPENGKAPENEAAEEKPARRRGTAADRRRRLQDKARDAIVAEYLRRRRG